MRELPVEKLAVFVSGLSHDSRSMRAVSGMNITLTEYLLAVIADRLGTLAWFQTEDGRKGRNRPESIAQLLTGGGKNKEEKPRSFTDAAAFEKAWHQIFRS